MGRKEVYTSRFVREVMLICMACSCAGLIAGRDMIHDGFSGKLKNDIRQQLEQQVAAKAEPAQSGNGGHAISIIEIDAARQLCDSGSAFFIDSRPPGIYADGHIPGAVNITGQTLDEHMTELMESVEYRDIVVYCADNECPEAMDFAHVLVENGIGPVSVFAGGWDQWLRQGYPAAQGAEP